MKRTFFLLICFISFALGSISWTALADSEVAAPLTEDHPSVNTLVAVGDLNFESVFGAKIIADPNYPWVDVKEILNAATLRVGNLEVPLSNRGSVYIQKKWTLHADPRTVKALISAKFNVVTLANNHMMDYGPLALEDTLTTLNNAGIAHTGAGMNLRAAREATVVTTPDGTKFAFLAYSLVFPAEFWAGSNRPGTAFGASNVFLTDIKKAKTLADFVVVSFHWSDEFQTVPFPYQIVDAHQCIDAGASLVLGHHPHVLQGLEVYRGGLIAYSLGNFAFGSYSKKCNDSIILGVDYDRHGLIQAKLYPVNINNYEVNFQTRLRHGADAQRVLNDLGNLSKSLNTDILTQEDVGLIKIRSEAEGDTSNQP